MAQVFCGNCRFYRAVIEQGHGKTRKQDKCTHKEHRQCTKSSISEELEDGNCHEFNANNDCPNYKKAK